MNRRWDTSQYVEDLMIVGYKDIGNISVGSIFGELTYATYCNVKARQIFQIY